MPGTSTVLVFAVASLTLIAIPGPSVIYIVARSLEHGRSAGLVSVLGVEAGALVHVAAAALGLSAVLVSSATAFTLVKWAGVAYLLFLGVQALRRPPAPPPARVRKASRGRLLRQGMLVNTLNPKVALFFLAFLPQFVDPERGSVAGQVALLGLLFVALACASDSAYAVAAGSVGERLRRSEAVQRSVDRISGGVYLLLAAAAGLSRDRARPS